jgi:hypothetical protein
MLTVDLFGRQVYGPYVEISKRKGKEKPRRCVICLYGSGRAARRKKMAYARWLMECSLKRELTADETVDHDDEDTLNDDIGNLKIMSHGDNIRKSHPGPHLIDIKCAYCGAVKVRTARCVLSNRKQFRTKHEYCSRRCAGLGWSANKFTQARSDTVGCTSL